MNARSCSLPVIALLLHAGLSPAQSLPESRAIGLDHYRRLQLRGRVSDSVSMMVRPVTAGLPEEEASAGGGLRRKPVLLPFQFRLRYNTALPYGWNDGPMVPSRGYQAYSSFGIAARYGRFSFQLAPEVVVAQNKKYEEFPAAYASAIQARYASYFTMDTPPLFGKGRYKRVFPGQSFIRAGFGAYSLGLSTENLWWGPGIRNALLMSNTAPGFPHLTLNTRRPAKAFFGSYELQVTGGRLTYSGFNPPGYSYLQRNTLLPDSARYFSGFVVSVQPKWVRGLHLGLARSFITYLPSMHSIGSYIPFVLPVFKNENHENAKSRNQLASLFFRWVWEAAGFEVYGEFGREDHNVNLRDLTLEPEHSRAYLAGLRKLVPLGAPDHDLLQLSLENTHLQQAILRKVRQEGSWYAHYLVRQGYTNQGQLLGAGVGSGNNLLSADVSWYRGINRVGIKFDKNDRYADQYYFILGLPDASRMWTDYSIAMLSQWKFGRALLNGKLQYIRSSNYWWQKNKRMTNIHAELGLQYDF